jgi:tetratricopeptide (TPR) repeat protein
LICLSLNNIGNVYRVQGNYTEALNNHLSALTMAEALGDKQIICGCYNFIGSIYALKEEYSKALYYFSTYLSKAEELRNKKKMAEAYSNIGYVYHQLNQNSKSLVNHRAALKLNEQIGSKASAAVCYENIGSIAMQEKNWSDARVNFNKALKLYQETSSKPGVRNTYYFISQLDSIIGQNDSSYKYFKLYAYMKDLILNEETNKQISQLKIQYETEKKDKDIEIKNIKISNQKVAIIYITIGFILLIVFALIFLRIYYQKEKNSIRHQILEAEMKVLRSQMNPHFTFNVLNSIQYYIGGNDMKSAERYLNKFAVLIRMILDQSRNAYITLGEEVSTLKLYLELEQMLFENKFQYSLNIDQKINSDKILIPGMLIQPIVENAIKHGLESKKGLAFIDIRFESIGSVLRCTVSDNGIGRTQSELNKGDSLHKSMASDIIRERMQALSYIFKIQLTYNTEDLFNSTGESEGTRVIIDMPIGIQQA